LFNPDSLDGSGCVLLSAPVDKQRQKVSREPIDLGNPGFSAVEGLTLTPEMRQDLQTLDQQYMSAGVRH